MSTAIVFAGCIGCSFLGIYSTEKRHFPATLFFLCMLAFFGCFLFLRDDLQSIQLMDTREGIQKQLPNDLKYFFWKITKYGLVALVSIMIFAKLAEKSEKEAKREEEEDIARKIEAKRVAREEQIKQEKEEHEKKEQNQKDKLTEFRKNYPELDSEIAHVERDLSETEQEISSLRAYKFPSFDLNKINSAVNLLMYESGNDVTFSKLHQQLEILSRRIERKEEKISDLKDQYRD